MANTTIPSELIAADAITGAKIADNAVDSEHYTDGSIDTAHIADDQVTLAKMAGLARGKVIVGDASGNPAALAIGTSGYVLKSDGTDIAWAADADTAALTTEQVQDIAGAMFASNTETGITATYQDADGTIDLVVGTLNQNTTGSAATLTTARAIAVAGDVTGTANFDGSAAISITTTLATDAIVTANITNANVTVAKMAANSVDSDQYVDGSIDTAHISDNAITLAKMASGTDGNIISFDASGNPVAIATGSDGQVLTSTGAGSPPAFEDAAGGGFDPDGAVVFNESSADVDFRVESNALTHALFVDGGTNTVHVGNSNASADGSFSNMVIGTGSGNEGITILGATNGASGIAFADTDSLVVGKQEYDHSTNSMLFTTGGSSALLRLGAAAGTTLSGLIQITSYGNIGLGRTPQYYGSNKYFDMIAGANGAMVLQLIGHNGVQKMNLVAGTANTSIINETNTELKFGVNQTAHFTINTSGVMAGDFNDTSDANLKENVESIAASTNIIKQLRAVTFDWKETTHKNDKDEDVVVSARRNKAGFIAQEVKAISGLEHAVAGTAYVDGNQPTESLSVDTLTILAHAIKTIQELEARITVLEG